MIPCVASEAVNWKLDQSDSVWAGPRGSCHAHQAGHLCDSKLAAQVGDKGV